jgi:transposase-like protein
MTKYSLETKLAAVRAYLEGVDSFKVTAQKYNVSVSMLKKWVTKYREHGSEAFQKMYTNYSMEFKMDVINYMNETGASIEETSARFNIPYPFLQHGVELEVFIRNTRDGRSSTKEKGASIHEKRNKEISTSRRVTRSIIS